MSFCGGAGKIESCKFENGNWEDPIEMPLGAEPIFGRIGAESLVILDEVELYSNPI